MEFPITKCAMEGFQVIKRAPASVAVWTLLYLVVIGLMIAGVFTVMGQAGMLTAMGRGSTQINGTDPSAAFKAVGSMMGVIGLMMPLSIALGVVTYCAIMRAVLRPEDKAFFYLRLGGDEVRVFVLSLVYYILAMVVFGVLVGGTALGCIAEWKANKGLAVLIGVLGGLAVFAVAVFLWNRLCLSFPATFASRSVRLFDGWRLSRGRFWPLVGMNLLALLLAIAVNFAFGMAAMIFQLSAMGGIAGALSGDSAPMTTSAIVGLSIAFGIRLIGAVIQTILTTAPTAAAYLAITKPNQAAEF